MSNDKTDDELQVICSDLIHNAVDTAIQYLRDNDSSNAEMKVASMLVSCSISIATQGLGKGWHEAIHRAILDRVMTDMMNQVKTIPKGTYDLDTDEDNPFSDN